jgi:anti-sigma B factor antagonist
MGEVRLMSTGKVSTERVTFLGLPVVVASGEVDLALAPALEEQISAALDERQGVVVDLGGSTFIDSVALGTLISARQRCEASGEALYLIVADDRVKRVFELTGLLSAFVIFDSREGLVEQLGSETRP